MPAGSQSYMMTAKFVGMERQASNGKVFLVQWAWKTMLEVPNEAAPRNGDKMNRFYPNRNSFANSKYIRFLVFFWMYLLTIYLVSLWT